MKKTLDAEGLSLIFNLRSAGKTQEQIAEELNKLGYVTASHGVPFTSGTVSYILTNNGIRARAKRERGSTKAKTTSPSSFLTQVEEIMTSNLSPELKEKTLRTLGVGGDK
jgi:hypothetical protein